MTIQHTAEQHFKAAMLAAAKTQMEYVREVATSNLDEILADLHDNEE